ncbi:tRNA-dihydrouridine synthase [Kalmanozyma brasiliensis GHG001]|uniref:DUS-like FMN-binding domain-containing protein n=1 Tax=Kalmanozyma brasiliensis (strain GHG001) TaxID=1365824 RepID=V5EUV9_KALBG|nr:tRNA-dihydrouridine synthase [Kalmanozyma brasiliensis GHG001]EST05949.1 tRNA-dihydrouridine synthase [Kalmanozyma brasiliensis GHG001]
MPGINGPPSDPSPETCPSYDPDALQLPPHLLLDAFHGLNVCAPMVRYSKLAFRTLVSRYETHITTTPMILAKEFSRTEAARNSEFSTNEFERGTFELLPDVPESSQSAQRRLFQLASSVKEDTLGEAGREAQAIARKMAKRKVRVRGALVAQFASSEPGPFADATELIGRFVDGVDLNCGCPQPWAYEELLGSYLLRQPETVRDMVRAVKARMGEDFCVSVKIRIDPDLKLTDALVRNALHAGASVLQIHGRTRWQSSAGTPVDLDGIKFAVDAANACGFRTAWGSRGGAEARFADGGSGGLVPCVANGDVWTLDDAIGYREKTGCRGAMSARGLLANPALFAGYDKTPKEAVGLFHQVATSWGLHTALIQRHLAYMLEESFWGRAEAIHFNSLSGAAAMTDYLAAEGLLLGNKGHVDPLAERFGYGVVSSGKGQGVGPMRCWSVSETLAGMGL